MGTLCRNPSTDTGDAGKHKPWAIPRPSNHRTLFRAQEIHALLGAERLLLIHELPEEGRRSSQFREADGAGPGSDLTVYHLRPPDQCGCDREFSSCCTLAAHVAATGEPSSWTRSCGEQMPPTHL